MTGKLRRPPPVAVLLIANMLLLLYRFKSKKDSYHDTNLFTTETYGAVDECKKKAKYLADVLPAKEMYSEVPATSRMRHSLSFKLSGRGESHVESAQGQQQHYANVGMRDAVAEQYILRGHARANMKVREKVRWNNIEDEKKRESIPVWLRGVPFYYDEHHLWCINQNVVAGRQNDNDDWVPFGEAEVLPEDNGERFLAAYAAEQKARRASGAVAKDKAVGRLARCPCTKCLNNAEALTPKGGDGGGAILGGRAASAWALVEDDDTSSDDGDGDSGFPIDMDDDDDRDDGFGHDIGKAPIGEIHDTIKTARVEQDELDGLKDGGMVGVAKQTIPWCVATQQQQPMGAMQPWNPIGMTQQQPMGMMQQPQSMMRGMPGQWGQQIPWGQQQWGQQQWIGGQQFVGQPMMMQQQPMMQQQQQQQMQQQTAGVKKRRGKYFTYCCQTYVNHRKQRKPGRPKHDDNCELMLAGG